VPRALLARLRPAAGRLPESLRDNPKFPAGVLPGRSAPEAGEQGGPGLQQHAVDAPVIAGAHQSHLPQLPFALAALRGQDMAGRSVVAQNFSRGRSLKTLGGAAVRFQLGQSIPPLHAAHTRTIPLSRSLAGVWGFVRGSAERTFSITQRAFSLTMPAQERPGFNQRRGRSPGSPP